MRDDERDERRKAREGKGTQGFCFYGADKREAIARSVISLQ